MFTGLSLQALWVLVGTLAVAFGFAPLSVANYWLVAGGAGAASLVLFIAAKMGILATRR